MDKERKQFFEKAYEAYYTKLYNYVYYRVLSDALADEIVSETFVKLVSYHQLCSSANSLSAWIFTIARNLVTDYYYKTANSFLAVPKGGAQKGLAAHGQRARMQLLLAELSERERSVVALHCWWNMSAMGIGKYLGLPEKNVSAVLSRAVNKLYKKRRDMETSSA